MFPFGIPWFYQFPKQKITKNKIWKENLYKIGRMSVTHSSWGGFNYTIWQTWLSTCGVNACLILTKRHSHELWNHMLMKLVLHLSYTQSQTLTDTQNTHTQTTLAGTWCNAVNVHLTHLLCWSIPYWHSSSDCPGCDQQWLDAPRRRPSLSTLSRSGHCRMPSVAYRWYWASPWEDLKQDQHTVTTNRHKHKSSHMQAILSNVNNGLAVVNLVGGGWSHLFSGDIVAEWSPLIRCR